MNNVATSNSFKKSHYEGKYVTIDYNFTDKDGKLLGSSEKSGSFTFCMGAGDAIPGLEDFIFDANIGETRKFIIPAEKAYGIYDENLIKILPKNIFPESLVLSVGLQLFINHEKVVITDFNDDEVTVNSNHPLAGVDLHFEASITEVHDEAPEGCGCDHSCGCSGGE